MTIENVLIIGGGVTGSVAAIALAQRGVSVRLVERSPEWYGVGHGITVHGNALRAFEEIGVAQDIIAGGVPFNMIAIGDAQGSDVVRIPTPRTGGPELPATLGTLRASMQDVLVSKIRELRIDVRLGTTVTSVASNANGIDVTLSDGEVETYDLVIAADGIKSQTRELLGIAEKPKSSGMGIWRFVTTRTPEMDTSAVFYGGPWYKVGYAPINASECYAYILTDPEKPGDPAKTDAENLRDMLQGYGGVWEHIRESITEDTYSNFQPIEWLWVDESWHRGRMIAIGDAVHACPPLIAQGAAMCAEDAVLLADYATRNGELEVLLEEFEMRRKPRVRLVVENSMKMVYWELHPEAPESDAPRLMEASLAEMTVPA